MTPQFLVVKIEALLSGRAEMSAMQKRSLALEYFRMCSEAEAQIEHCISLIKSNREYTALQVAESCNLLDNVNALLFEKQGQWIDFCKAEGFPYPEAFDFSLIHQISALYSKGITQAHPLYRDYRRAMRLRKYDAALAVIRTISKINALDAEARAEYQRLRKAVVKNKLASLEAALKKGDADAICSLVNALEGDADLVVETPLWKEALSKKRELETAKAKKRWPEIVAELKRTDSSAEWQKTMELAAEFNLLREFADIPEADIKFVEVCESAASVKNAEHVAREKAASAMNMLAIELENPKKGSAIKKLTALKKLRASALIALADDAEMQKRLSARTAKLRAVVLTALSAYAAVGAFAVLLLCYVIYIAQNSYRSAARESAAIAELAMIANLNDFAAKEKALDVFMGKYPELSESPYFAGKIENVRESAATLDKSVARVERMLVEIETVNMSEADSVAFDRAQQSAEKVSAEIAGLPAVYQAQFKDRLDAFSKKFNDALDMRRMKRNAQMRSGLDKYESLIERYNTLEEDKSGLDAELTSILKNLRPMIEDVSGTFKAHQIDVDRFNDITARMMMARSRYIKIDDAKARILGARTLGEYVDALAELGQNTELPPSFERKVSRVASQRGSMELGQLAAFGVDDIAAANDMPRTFGRQALPDDDILTRVYKYRRGERGDIYTLGPVSQQMRTWNTGSEITQEAAEIDLGGKPMRVVYRLNEIRGKAPVGEILTDGALSKESMLGENIVKTASSNSLISALTMVGNANVNPVYKLYWENLLLREMQKNPAESGLAYSPSAKARIQLVEKYAKGVSPYSWLFEKESKVNLLNSELYGEPTPNYLAEAENNKIAIGKAMEDHMFLIGISDENGKWHIFKDNSGAIWAVDSDGKFRRFESAPQEGDIAPLSPIMSEVYDAETFLKNSEKNK